MLRGFLSRLGFKRKPRSPLLSARTFEPSSHPLRPVLDERYAAMKAAMASGSPEPIAALLAPGFTSEDVFRRVSDAEQMIASVLALNIDRSKRTTKTTLFDIKSEAGKAEVLQHYEMRAMPDAPASMPRMVQSLSYDVWLEIDGEWLLGKTKTLTIETTDANGRFAHAGRIEVGTIEITRLAIRHE